MKWMLHWIDAALRTFEAQLARDARYGLCCLGDTPTMADLCLVAPIRTAQSVPGSTSLSIRSRNASLLLAASLRLFIPP
jgi:glutathione S-transferase